MGINFSSWWRGKKGSNLRAGGLQQVWQELLNLEKRGDSKKQHCESLQKADIGPFKAMDRKKPGGVC